MAEIHRGSRICLVLLLAGYGCDARKSEPNAAVGSAQPQAAREARPPITPHKLQAAYTAMLAETGSYGIAWGVVGDRLAYVVFTGPRAIGVTSPVTSSSIGRSGSAESIQDISLARPDGTIAKLPDNIQLRQIIDGRYEESSREVTLEDFEAFRRSGPDAYTIERLLEFAEARSNRAKPTSETK